MSPYPPRTRKPLRPIPADDQSAELQQLLDLAAQSGFDVTSTNRGRHNPGSAHYENRAIDLRTRNKRPAEVDAIAEQARQAGYDVADERARPSGQQVWTGPHLHIETPRRKRLTPMGSDYLDLSMARDFGQDDPASGASDYDDWQRQMFPALDVAGTAQSQASAPTADDLTVGPPAAAGPAETAALAKIRMRGVIGRLEQVAPASERAYLGNLKTQLSDEADQAGLPSGSERLAELLPAWQDRLGDATERTRQALEKSARQRAAAADPVLNQPFHKLDTFQRYAKDTLGRSPRTEAEVSRVMQAMPEADRARYSGRQAGPVREVSQTESPLYFSESHQQNQTLETLDRMKTLRSPEQRYIQALGEAGDTASLQKIAQFQREIANARADYEQAPRWQQLGLQAASGLVQPIASMARPIERVGHQLNQLIGRDDSGDATRQALENADYLKRVLPQIDASSAATFAREGTQMAGELAKYALALRYLPGSVAGQGIGGGVVGALTGQRETSVFDEVPGWVKDALTGAAWGAGGAAAGRLAGRAGQAVAERAAPVGQSLAEGAGTAVSGMTAFTTNASLAYAMARAEGADSREAAKSALIGGALGLMQMRRASLDGGGGRPTIPPELTEISSAPVRPALPPGAPEGRPVTEPAAEPASPVETQLSGVRARMQQIAEQLSNLQQRATERAAQMMRGRVPSGADPSPEIQNLEAEAASLGAQEAALNDVAAKSWSQRLRERLARKTEPDADLAQVMDDLNRGQAGREVASVEESVNAAAKDADDLLTLARAETDPARAAQALDLARKRYQSALAEIRNAPQYEAEILAAARGEAPQTPLRDRALQIERQLAEIGSRTPERQREERQSAAATDREARAREQTQQQDRAVQEAERGRQRLFDQAQALAAEAGERAHQAIEAGRYDEALVELSAQQKAIGEQMRRLPDTPDGLRLRMDLQRQAGQIGNQMGALRTQSRQSVAPAERIDHADAENLRPAADRQPALSVRPADGPVTGARAEAAETPESAVLQLTALPVRQAGLASEQTAQPALPRRVDPATISRSESPLSPAHEAIEDRFVDYLANNPDEAIAEYRRRFGREVSGDLAKELSSDYAASDESRSLLSAAVHEPASWLARQVYAALLREPLKPGEDPVVVFTAGGTGAGKTSSLKGLAGIQEAVNRAQMIVDSNLANAGSAIKKIDQALAAGRQVKIIATWRDPFEAWQNGVLPRAEKIGRAMPVDVHLATHAKMARSLKEIVNYYADDPRVSLIVVDNSHGRHGAVEAKLDIFKELGDTTELRKQLVEEVEKQYANGQISRRVYRGSLVGGGGGARAPQARGAEDTGDAGARGRNDRQPEPERAERLGSASRHGRSDAGSATSDERGAADLPAESRTGGGRRASLPESPAPVRGTVGSETGGAESGGVSRVAGAQSALTVPRTHRTYPVRYEVRELSDLQPSHNPFTFERNPRYSLVNDRDYTVPANRADVERAARPGVFDPRLLLSDDPTATNGPPIIDQDSQVLGGNSRTMMLQRVFRNHPEVGAAYRRELASRAPQFGLDPASLTAFREPVLVRVTDPAAAGVAPQKVITDLNIQPGKALSATEEAAARARSLPPATMQYLAGRLSAEGPDGTLAQALEGGKGVSVLNRLIEDGVIPAGERNRYLTDQGALSPAAKSEIEHLLLGRMFRDGEQMKRTAPEMKNKLARIAPQTAKLAGTAWDVTELIPSALEAVSQAKAEKLDLSQLNARGQLFGESQPFTAEQLAIAQALMNEGLRGIEKKFREYAAAWEEAQRGGGLFGEPRTQAEAFRDIFPAPGEDSVMYARPAPGFNSQLERVIEQKMPNSATADQVRAIVSNPQHGVKAEEVKWLGLDIWLREHPKPTKQELLDFVKSNRIEVQEIVKGAPDPFRADRDNLLLEQGQAIRDMREAGEPERAAVASYLTRMHRPPAELQSWIAGLPDGIRERIAEIDAFNPLIEALDTGIDDSENPNTKYDQYALPGAEAGSYRELLLTLPLKSADLEVFKAGDGKYWVLNKTSNSLVGDTGFFGGTREQAERHLAELRQSGYGGSGDNYTSPHYDERNILAHIRFNEHRTANGERVLLIEEIQSDWHQAGRRHGYRERQEPWVVYEQDTNRVLARFRTLNDAEAEMGRLTAEGHQRLDVQMRRGETSVPDAPFKNTWPELAFKRALRWAVENGYDQVAWATGETQAARYDLSKRISAVHYSGTNLKAFDLKGNEVISRTGVQESDLPDYIGKEAAGKLLAQPKQGTLRSLTGVDLKVGGEGMKAFYDQMLPSFARKYVRKWGAQVEETSLPTGAGKRPRRVKVHVVRITPQMRESVMAGQSLFAAEAGFGRPLVQGAADWRIEQTRHGLPDRQAGWQVFDGDSRPLGDAFTTAREARNWLTAQQRWEASSWNVPQFVVGTTTPAEGAARVRARWHRPQRGRGREREGVLWINVYGAAAIDSAIRRLSGRENDPAVLMGGAAIAASYALRLARDLEQRAARYSGAGRERLLELAREIKYAASQTNQQSIVIARVDPSINTTRSGLLRHERGVHVAQFELRAESGQEIDPIWLTDDSLYPIVRDRLRRMGYPDSQIPAEVPAWLAEGRAEDLGLETWQAEDLMLAYLQQVYRQHGERGFEAFRDAGRLVRDTIEFLRRDNEYERRGAGVLAGRAGEPGQLLPAAGGGRGTAAGAQRGKTGIYYSLEGGRGTGGSSSRQGVSAAKAAKAAGKRLTVDKRAATSDASASSGSVKQPPSQTSEAFRGSSEESVPTPQRSDKTTGRRTERGTLNLFGRAAAPASALRELPELSQHRPLQIDPARIDRETREAITQAFTDQRLPGARLMKMLNLIGAQKKANKLAARQARFVRGTAQSLVNLWAAHGTMQAELTAGRRGSVAYQEAQAAMARARLEIGRDLDRIQPYSKPLDYAGQATRAAMLSSLRIPLYNLIDQALTLPLHELSKAVPVKWLENLLARHAGVEPVVTGLSAGNLAEAAARGLSRALPEGYRSIRYGRTERELLEDLLPERRSGDKYERGERARLIPGLDTLVNGAFRIQQLADIPGRGIIFEQSIRDQADRIARSVAQQRKLSPRQEKLLARDLAWEPSEEMARLAAAESSRFVHDVETPLYDLIQRTRAAGETTPQRAYNAIHDQIVPFSRIPAAALRAAFVDYTPIGLIWRASDLLQAARDYKAWQASDGKRGKPPLTPVEFQDKMQRLRQGVVGTGILLLLGLLTETLASWYLKGRDDRARMASVQEAMGEGYDPAILVGEVGYPMAKGGVAGVQAAAMVAVKRAFTRRHDDTGLPAGQAGAESSADESDSPETGTPERGRFEPRSRQFARAGKQLLKSTIGEAPLLKDIYGAGEGATLPERILRSRVRSTVPSAVRDYAKRQEPAMRLPEETGLSGQLKYDFQSGIPAEGRAFGLPVRQDLRRRLNAIGGAMMENNLMNGRRYLPTPELRRLQELEVGLSAPKRKGGETVDEFSIRQQRQGRLNRESLPEVTSPLTQRMSDEAQRDYLRREFTPAVQARTQKLSGRAADTDRDVAVEVQQGERQMRRESWFRDLDLQEQQAVLKAYRKQALKFYSAPRSGEDARQPHPERVGRAPSGDEVDRMIDEARRAGLRGATRQRLNPMR